MEPPDCEDGPLVTGELFVGYHAVLCVFNGDSEEGVAGLQCSLDYDGGSGSGVEIDRWVNCATFEIPQDNWPNPSAGNRITWDRVDNCQKSEPGGAGNGVTAVAGFFYLTAYSPDRMSIKEWSGQGETTLKIAKCDPTNETTIPLARARSLGL